MATIRRTTDGVVESLSNLTDQAQTSLVDQTARRAGDLSNGIIDTLFQRVSSTFGGWVTQHPIAGWLLTHPILSVIALVLSVSLLWTLIALLGRLLQQTWLTILKAPLVVLLWIGGQILRGLKGAIAQPKALPVEPPQTDRVADILSRLDHIRQEQDHLMQELKTLLEQSQEERAKEPR